MTISCDAIKIAMRQNKEGYVISFSVTPQEMHSDLADALIPSYWRLTLTPMDEQGNFETPAASMPVRGAAEETISVEAAPRPRKSWDEIDGSQQAGILCADKAFQKFIAELVFPIINPNEIHAKRCVHEYCRVASRSELKVGTGALERWRDLVERYRTWQLAAQVVPA